MQSSKNNSTNHQLKRQTNQTQVESTLGVADQKHSHELDGELQSNNKQLIMDSDNTKVYELKNSSNKRQMRTMVVIHT